MTIMPLAALVSASRRCTVAASVAGESAAARALASSLTAWCASMASIAGSSSVAADFSYCVILFPYLFVVVEARKAAVQLIERIGLADLAEAADAFVVEPE